MSLVPLATIAVFAVLYALFLLWYGGRSAPLGFLKAVDTDGEPLVRGKRMTAVTDKQVRELGIEITPLHPETELRKASALFESATAFKDILANHVVMDGNLVTGQNQNAGAEVAQDMMMLLSRKAGAK